MSTIHRVLTAIASSGAPMKMELQQIIFGTKTASNYVRRIFPVFEARNFHLNLLGKLFDVLNEQL